MADNFSVTAGSGTVIAADDISSVYYQRVKIAQGADGVGVDVSSAAPLQVTLANTGANATPVSASANLFMGGTVVSTSNPVPIQPPASGTLAVANTPITSGGLSVANFNTGDTYTALTNSAQAIKASAGQLYGYYIYNPNSSATYVMVYNVAHGSVTVGTTTPQMVFCIPATSGANLDLTHGIAFSTAMSIAAATTGGGNTAPTTALEAMVFYK